MDLLFTQSTTLFFEKLDDFGPDGTAMNLFFGNQLQDLFFRL